MDLQLISLLGTNDEQLLSYVTKEYRDVISYYIGSSSPTLESVIDAIESTYSEGTQGMPIRELLGTLPKGKEEGLLFDGNTYVPKVYMDTYMLEVEESQSESQEVVLYGLGQCTLFPSLSRIVYTVDDYDFVGDHDDPCYVCKPYTKRINVCEYKALLSQSLSVLSDFN